MELAGDGYATHVTFGRNTRQRKANGCELFGVQLLFTCKQVGVAFSIALSSPLSVS